MELTTKQITAIAAIEADRNVHSARLIAVYQGYAEVMVNSLAVVSIAPDGLADWDQYYEAEVDLAERREYGSNCAMDW